MDRFISMWKVRELADKVTNVVMNYTEIEGKVREATSDEAWGPTGQQMQELALATFTYEHFPEVMSMLWRRMLHDNRSHWRRTYKCLLLLSYLVRNGSERVVTSAREHIYDLRSLENYTNVDDLGKDQGINVRHKVRELIEFIQDDEKLREERKKAKKNKDKYIGMSSEAAVMGMGGTRSGSAGWGEYSDRSSNWDEPKERNDDDEYTREDSDDDYGHRKPSKENVYRDSEQISSSPPRRSGRPSPDGPAPAGRADGANKPLSISLKSPAKQKPSTPNKKIDLGAAASYGKSSTTPAPPSAGHKSQELLDDLFKTCPVPSPGQPSSLVPEDDFDPRAEEIKPPSRKDSEDFGDFANAFGASQPGVAPAAPAAPVAPLSLPVVAPVETGDGFADFTSAFTGGSAPAASPATQPSSNLDLLSDLGAGPLSFSSMPPMSNTSNMSDLSGMDALTGQLSAVTLQPLGDVLQPQGSGCPKTTTQERLLRALRTFQETLHAIERLKNDNDVRNIKTCFQNVDKYLPGPVTVQKLTNIDEKVLSIEVTDTFTQLLSMLVKYLMPEWPLLKEEILNLCIIEESFELSKEILTLICGFLKSETNRTVLEALADILSRYVKSDMILTAAADVSSRKFEDNNALYRYQTDWECYVQMLVTLPERVANKLEKNTPKEFSHENFSYNLIFHIIRSMDFMSEGCFHEGIRYDMSYLSHLLSKVVINYNMNGNSDAISKFVDILIVWAGNENVEPCKFVKRKLIQALLFHLNRQAIDCLSVIILQKCPIDYKSKEQTISHILGENFDKSKDWSENLSMKIPFYFKPKEYRDTHIIENLIYYISTSNNSEKTITDLILRLGNVWADLRIYNTANINQHMFISLLLVLATKYRVIYHKRKQNWHCVEIKAILFKGMSKHLDLIYKDLRCIGMATTEVMLKLLTEIDEKDKEAVEKLKFEYEEMGQNCVEIANMLKEMPTKCLIDKKHKKPKDAKPRNIDLKDILDTIAEKATGEQRLMENTVVSCAVKTQQQTKEIVKTIIAAKLDALKIINSNCEDLDSDDDLQPYDMGNDVCVNTRKRPHYLRDLIEILTEAKDAESFAAAFAVSEELVTKQLKNDNPKLAVELLDLFIHLEPKYHVDHFDTIKFNTCVVIVCNQSKVCAEHLCKEIHTDVGRYSIATKMFMLDVLSESANRIADVRPQTVEQKTTPQIVTTEEENTNLAAEEVIRRRLINKTRYIHTIQTHPFAKAKRNEFAAVADSFFYPLVGGFGFRQLTLSQHNIKQDFDKILFYKYLQVVGNIILASKNCPKCPQYCAEVVPMLLYMRYTPDPKIQSYVIALVATVVLVLPSLLLRTEFFEAMVEFRSWLTDLLTNVDLTMRLGGPKSETAIFAGQILQLIEKNLGEYNLV
ncbi:telomere length regulation protein TEL2 homolog [Pectinophora gossypiella]|nr:telomere length regulation protein TEL2 homolog [Pectinophora gossypiella]